MYSKCQKCGKKLTDPESIRRGYGPECWESITGQKIKNFYDMMDYEVPGQMSMDDFMNMEEQSG